MVAHGGIHDDDEVSVGVFQPVDVGGPEAMFAGSRFEHDALRGVEGLELLCDGERAVWRGIVYDD